MILKLYNDAASIDCHAVTNGRLYNSVKEWQGSKIHINLRAHGTYLCLYHIMGSIYSI
jgi:hypothetical protein